MPTAPLGLDASHFAQYLVNGLAVGGGFLAGYLLTWVLARLLDRWLTAGKSPPAVHKVARLLGGLAAAVLVALIVFGRGGAGLGFGGGAGTGNGPDPANGAGTGSPTPATPPTSVDVKVSQQATPEAVPAEQRLRVTVLGGENVKDRKFYRVDDGPAATDFAGLKAAVAKKRADVGKPVTVEVRYDAGAGPDTPGTRVLVREAADAGFAIVLPGGPK